MKYSAGILCYNDNHEVFLLKPGGPLFADQNVRTIPKGEFDMRIESAYEAGFREFIEETGYELHEPLQDLVLFEPVPSASNHKTNIIWMCYEPNVEYISCNEFEYPKGSGNLYPECESGEWVTLQIAKQIIFPSLLPFIEMAEMHLREKVKDG